MLWIGRRWQPSFILYLKSLRSLTLLQINADLEKCLSSLKFIILPFAIPRTVVILMAVSLLYNLVKYLEITLNQEIINLNSSHQNYMMFHLIKVSLHLREIMLIECDISLGNDCHIFIFSRRLVTRFNSAVHSQPIVIVSRSGSRLYFFSSWIVCGRYFVSSLVLLNLMRISSSCSLSTLMPHNLEHFWATTRVKGGYTAPIAAISM